MLTSLRHHRSITQAVAGLDDARHAATSAIPHEMILLDLYRSLWALDSLTGQTTRTTSSTSSSVPSASENKSFVTIIQFAQHVAKRDEMTWSCKRARLHRAATATKMGGLQPLRRI